MPDTSVHADGFSLAEVLVAMVLLAILSTSVAGLIVASARSLARSRLDTTATLLAHGRLEQLRSLTWSYGSAFAPAPAVDVATNLSTASPSAGGPGLSASPPAALGADSPGYVDYLDNRGRWIGNTPPAPAAARFVRRWSISPVAGHADLLLLRVTVTDARRPWQAVEVATLRARTAG